MELKNIGLEIIERVKTFSLILFSSKLPCKIASTAFAVMKFLSDRNPTIGASVFLMSGIFRLV